MQFPTLRTILISLTGVTIVGLSCVGTIYAINTISEGYRIGAGGGAAYSGIYGGFGAMIQNPGGSYYRARRTGGDIFVPTRSWGEWGAVTTVAPGIGLEIAPNGLTWRSWYYNYDQWNGDHWDHHVEPYCNDETFGNWNNYGVSVNIWWCQNYDRNGNNWYPGNMWAYQGQAFNGYWHYH